MLTITRTFEFDAAHKLLNHESKCRFLHGHRYKVEFTVYAPELDNVGRVIDFSYLKRDIGGWIDVNLDHNTILNPDDPFLMMDYLPIIGREPFRMPITAKNPTAENLAMVLFAIGNKILRPPLLVRQVRIFETPNCQAVYDSVWAMKSNTQLSSDVQLPPTPPDIA